MRNSSLGYVRMRQKLRWLKKTTEALKFYNIKLVAEHLICNIKTEKKKYKSANANMSNYKFCGIQNRRNLKVSDSLINIIGLDNP